MSVQLVTDSGTYDVGVVDDIDVGFRVGDASTYYNFFNPNEWQEAWTDQDLQLSHRANTANDAEVWSAMSFTGWVSWILSGTDVAFGMLGVSGISNYTGGYYQHLDGAEGIRADVEDAYNGQIDFSDLFSNEFGSADESARIQVFAEDGTLIDEFMVSGDDDGVVSYSFSTANAFSHIVINAGAYDENGNFIYGSYAQDNGLAIASLPGTGSELLLSAMQFGYRAAESISVATAATANDAGTSNEVAPNEAEFDFTGIDEVSIDIYEKGAKQISTSVPKTVVSDDASVSEGSHQEYINQELDFSSTEQSNVVMSTDQLVYQKIYGANQNTASIVSSDAETLAIVDLDFMHIDDDPFDLSGVGDYLIK